MTLGAEKSKYKGNPDILQNCLVGFFCSLRCPGDVILKTHDLARTLRKANLTIIGGFQSPTEREFLDLLLRGTAPIVVCPVRGLEGMRIPGNWKKPLADGQLLILSFFIDGVRRATADLASQCNSCVAALAERIVIAHAGKGNKTERLCEDALSRGKPVFALDSADNAHLIELGAVPLPADDPTPLVAEGIVRAG